MPRQSLNPIQRFAVEHGEGPCLVLAGPGSGKTFVITKRIEYLVHQKQIPPEQILVITFTRAAALEMKQRFLRLMGDSYLPVQFGTFHAIFFHILKQTEQLNEKALLTTHEKQELMEACIEQVLGRGNTDISLSELILKEISRRKNLPEAMEHPSYKSLKQKIGNLTDEQVLQITQHYEQLIRTRRKLDFDDMVTRCRDLFLEDNEVLAYWQSQFTYLLIDEFQDINSVQFQVVQMLSAKHQNLFVVGDDDQSIYGFRGSQPEIMLRFSEFYPNTRVLQLDTNYRSRSQIVASAAKVIEHNERRYPKQIHAVKEEQALSQVQEEVLLPIADSSVCTQYFTTQEQQHVFLLSVVKEQNRRLSQIAIIFRTNQAAKTTVELLTKHNIPYQSREKLPNPFEHFIVQDLLAYLRLAYQAANSYYNRSDFYRIMNKPKRYLGRSCVQEEKFSFAMIRSYYRDKYYMKEHIDKFEYLLNRIRDMAVYPALWYIRKQGGYERYLMDYAKEKNLRFQDLIAVLDEFMELVKECVSLREVEMQKELFDATIQEAAKEQEDAVHILTFHGSKGLEFDTVILPDLQEGIVPHRKASDLEEERRMFYVAMTRAKEKLYLLAVQGTKEHPQFPSRFLKEIM